MSKTKQKVNVSMEINTEEEWLNLLKKEVIKNYIKNRIKFNIKDIFVG